MAASVTDRGLDIARLVVINNLDLEPESDISDDRARHAANELPLPENGLRIMFSGNIGVFQALDKVAELASSLAQREDVHFIFLGDGRYRRTLMDALEPLRGKTVHFLDFQPVAVARELMSRVELNLVSLSAGVSRCSYPSKVLTIASLGGAFVVVDDDDSALCRSVRHHGAGLAVGHSELSTLKQALSALADDPSTVADYRRGSAAFYAAELDSGVALNRWSELFAEASK